MGEAAVSEDAGYCLDVGSVAQQIRSAAVAGAVPGDVLFDTGTDDSVALHSLFFGMQYIYLKHFSLCETS